MLKKLQWREDAVINVCLRDDLFTLAQMRKNSLMQFFDIRSADGKWQGVDLGAVDELFCIFVAENRLKPLFTEMVEESRVTPNRRSIPRVMLSAVLGNQGVHGADLIELSEGYSSVGGGVVKRSLSPSADLDLIYKHELTGMVGSAEKLRARLIRYFDTGVNWDESKGFLFKDIPLPKPTR